MSVRIWIYGYMYLSIHLHNTYVHTQYIRTYVCSLSCLLSVCSCVLQRAPSPRYTHTTRAWSWPMTWHPTTLTAWCYSVRIPSAVCLVPVVCNLGTNPRHTRIVIMSHHTYHIIHTYSECLFTKQTPPSVTNSMHEFICVHTKDIFGITCQIP